ncbi:MAG: helix-turn-helix domain-containing protein [Hyphomicrobiales bacterium]
MDERDAFGLQLKAIRTGLSWSQQRLADVTGLSVEAISNLERGLNKPSYATMERLAAALNVPIRHFFEFDDHNPERSQHIASLLAHARKMTDGDLKRAVAIMHVLSERS